MLSKVFILASLAMNINANIIVEEFTERAVSVIVPNEATLPHSTPYDMVEGTLRLEDNDIFEKRIFGEITGLKPNAVHGLNIHEFGDISSKSMHPGEVCCHSTGAYYNEFDLGESGNIKADHHGVAKVDITLKNHDLRDVIGRSFVVHELEDDGTSSGRLGCGVIGISRPETPIDEEAEMGCIFQRSNIASEFLTESATLGREIEGGAIRCRQWIIRKESGFDCDGECVSIEITNPNPRFDAQYLSDRIVPNGELSGDITKSELWTMSLVNPVGLVQYVYQNQQTKQFLCAQDNWIGTGRILEFEASGDSERCHWELGQSQI